MGRFKNPLAAAAAWAERMSDPEAVEQRNREAAEKRRAAEAEQPPIPEADAAPDAVPDTESAAEEPPAPAAPAPRREKQPRETESLRSVVWAGCILLGVVCSLVSFVIGMVR